MNRLLLLCLFTAALAQAQPSTMFPPVRGTREMIGAGNNFQVEAGWRMLTSGGNAVDAGVAGILTATVTEQSRIGLGGEAPILIQPAGKPAIAISGIGTAPALATPEFYRMRKPELWEEPGRMGAIPSIGLRAATVPGLFDGLILALSEHGTKTYCEVAQPAIEAAHGFPIPDEYAKFIGELRNFLHLWPASERFFMPNGEAPRRGELFHSPTLAATLESLCGVEKDAKGDRRAKLQAVRDEFYKGSIGHKLARFSEDNGGLLRYDDLAKFHAEFDKPVTGTYRGYGILKPGFWTQGPVMIQALNILERFDLKAMRHNSPEYLHTVIEALKLAFADRDRYYGDPKFSKIPAETLLSKEYAADRAKLIDPDHASIEHRPGSFGGPMMLASIGQGRSVDHDTTCINVVDRFGNVFSATPSGAWLPSVIAGDTGIPFGMRLESFVLTAGHANLLAPGKRPRVTLSPTIVLKDGKPWLAMSTPGGDNQDQAMLQVLLNLIDFGMSPQEAVEAPRIQTEHFYASFGNHEFTPGRVNLESRILETTAKNLMEKGHRLAILGPWSNGSAPTVIRIDGGVLDGGADPRRSRFIFGR
ncbi:gamma-glutamyltransferase family protein [uncultured Paludibaculum sp.]|uniref:gamma-glutamyltransferase family protein n=1 Tax=uncultured Paludibaculum sp. TaxID=1765020 RepID=UPI002AAB20BE|nr:gamma-glutamyltransferase family protein [uncultured Paludibaculum sp.]